MRKLLIIIVLSIFSLLLFADDVIDSINEGLKYYKAGDYSQATESLNYASQLILQKKGGQLEIFFPKPLSGWNAEVATSTSAGNAMLGGGVTAERRYQNSDANVTIQFITDSPLLQSVLMIFSNPLFAASSGGKMERIAGQKAMVQYDANDRNGEVQIVINNRILVTVSGESIDRDILIKYAAAIDFDKMAKM